MTTLTVFQAGNSLAMTIPAAIVKRLGLKAGSMIELHESPSHPTATVNFDPKSIDLEAGLTPEFRTWLDDTTAKNKSLIEKLAHI